MGSKVELCTSNVVGDAETHDASWLETEGVTSTLDGDARGASGVLPLQQQPQPRTSVTTPMDKELSICLDKVSHHF